MVLFRESIESLFRAIRCWLVGQKSWTDPNGFLQFLADSWVKCCRRLDAFSGAIFALAILCYFGVVLFHESIKSFAKSLLRWPYYATHLLGSGGGGGSQMKFLSKIRFALVSPGPGLNG